MLAFDDVKALPTEQRVPRPLSARKQQALEEHQLHLSLARLADKFGKTHDDRPKEKAKAAAFDPFAPRVVGEVDWDKQRQDTSQRRFEGKRAKKQKKAAR
jgi:hypothetical protein